MIALVRHVHTHARQQCSLSQGHTVQSKPTAWIRRSHDFVQQRSLIKTSAPKATVNTKLSCCKVRCMLLLMPSYSAAMAAVFMRISVMKILLNQECSATDSNALCIRPMNVGGRSAFKFVFFCANVCMLCTTAAICDRMTHCNRIKLLGWTCRQHADQRKSCQHAQLDSKRGAQVSRHLGGQSWSTAEEQQADKRTFACSFASSSTACMFRDAAANFSLRTARNKLTRT
jgi:hypothetical protein